MRHIYLFLFLFPSWCLYAQSSLADSYIERYSDIAVSEMHRTGIPASITLAQGMLESNWGRSELAVESNNHFGIKCHNEYEGDTHMRYDDEYNALGLKKKSCFRVYDTPEESFFDHSDFLTDPKKQQRYGFLFEYGTGDYVNWAEGLSSAGYATDPAYAGKLIGLIERYELWKYDRQEELYTSVLETEPPISKQETFSGHRISYLNSCKVVISGKNTSLDRLADHIGVSKRTMMRHNPWIRDKKQLIAAGQVVFLERKKSYYLGDEEFHRLHPEESLADISNLYGIDEDHLRRINRLKKDQDPMAGSLVALKTGFRTDVKLAESPTNKRQLLVENSIYLFEKALEPFKQ